MGGWISSVFSSQEIRPIKVAYSLKVTRLRSSLYVIANHFYICCKIIDGLCKILAQVIRKNCNHLSVKNLNGSVYHYKESTSWSAPMKAPLCSGRCWRFKKSSDFESFLNVNSLHKTSIETRMFFKDSEKHYIKIFILQHILLNRLSLR